MYISTEEYYRRMAALVYDPTGPEVQIASQTIARQLEEEAMVRERAIAARTPPLPNVMPIMSEPTAPSGALPVTRVAEYLNSDPNKTAIALKKLAAGGYVVRVSINPDRWVRVVPVEVEEMKDELLARR